MAIDIGELVEEMKGAASQVLESDVSTVRGFSERQLKAIAQQALIVSKGIVSGEITAETREFFLDSLEDMALQFAKTLRGLLMVTIEKVWSAVVDVLWRAIKTATGIDLIPASV